MKQLEHDARKEENADYYLHCITERNASTYPPQTHTHTFSLLMPKQFLAQSS
jgi:hypothetical protein